MRPPRRAVRHSTVASGFGCARYGAGHFNVQDFGLAQDLCCWRCDTILPMLSEAEWEPMSVALSGVIGEIQRYRAEHGVGLDEAFKRSFGIEALDLYERMTGMRETNVNAIWHHRLSMYGPPCAHCGKPLRTPRA